MDQMHRVKREFLDELESLALLKKSVDIVFRAENGGRAALRDRITGLFERDGETFIRTASGMEISLAKLIEAGGIRAPDSC